MRAFEEINLLSHCLLCKGTLMYTAIAFKLKVLVYWRQTTDGRVFAKKIIRDVGRYKDLEGEQVVIECQ